MHQRAGESGGRRVGAEDAALALFCDRSRSEETRRAYRRVTGEFYRHVRPRAGIEVTASDVRRWRDHLLRRGNSPATVAFKLSVIRSYFEYLLRRGLPGTNPASSAAVPPPAATPNTAARVLTEKQVGYLLAGPDRKLPEGARDYALMCVILDTAVGVKELCSLKVSSLRRDRKSWKLALRSREGEQHLWPLAVETKAAVDEYRRLDNARRQNLHSGGPDAPLFQPHSNYRTLVFNKALSARAVRKIVARWGDFTGLGHLSPQDLRATAISLARSRGCSERELLHLAKLKSPRMLRRYAAGNEGFRLGAAPDKQ